LLQCEKITFENHVSNGGTLKRDNIVRDVDTEFIICVKDEMDTVLGFMTLSKEYCVINDIYIRQIAVATKFARKGIGSKIMECLF
jgi:ribosomal protein S18 acetylase RimI-like enzyme